MAKDRDGKTGGRAGCFLQEARRRDDPGTGFRVGERLPGGTWMSSKPTSPTPNYAERRRYGEWVSTVFAESTVNTVVGKRFSKRQQANALVSGSLQWEPLTLRIFPVTLPVNDALY